MKISSRTKISTILKQHPAAVEAIASISPHFGKLRNPVLRKLLAPRVTVADAARIGRCSPEDFASVLAPLGFEWQANPTQQGVAGMAETVDEIGGRTHGDTEELGGDAMRTPDKVAEESVTAAQPAGRSGRGEEGESSTAVLPEAVQEGRVRRMDVRPIIEAGVDPLRQIMETLEALPPGFALELVNSFEPIPLVRLLERKGYAAVIVHGDELVTSYFYKRDGERHKPHIADEGTAPGRDSGERTAGKRLLPGTEDPADPELPVTVSQPVPLAAVPAGDTAGHGQKNESSADPAGGVKSMSAEALAEYRLNFPGHIRAVDVRHMEMPMPMVTILEALEDMPDAEALYVHHQRVPLHQLPELEARGYAVFVADLGEGMVEVLLHR